MRGPSVSRPFPELPEAGELDFRLADGSVPVDRAVQDRHGPSVRPEEPVVAACPSHLVPCHWGAHVVPFYGFSGSPIVAIPVRLGLVAVASPKRYVGGSGLGKSGAPGKMPPCAGFCAGVTTNVRVRTHPRTPPSPSSRPPSSPSPVVASHSPPGSPFLIVAPLPSPHAFFGPMLAPVAVDLVSREGSRDGTIARTEGGNRGRTNR